MHNTEYERLRSARRRAEKKVEIARNLMAAEAQSAAVYHYTVGPADSLVREQEQELEKLLDTLTSMPKNKDTSAKFDIIGGKYREVAVPCPVDIPKEQRDLGVQEPRNYQIWDAIINREGAFARLPANLNIKQIVEDALDASKKSATEYFGSIPFVLNNVGLIYAQVPAH